MFIIKFFTGSIFGIISGIVLGTLTLVIILAVVVFVLAAAGGPGECTPGGTEIVISDANADAFDRKWDGFDSVLDAGSPSSVVINESEASSRAQRFVEEEAGAIDNVRVCIHDGFGEVTGSVDAFLGMSADFKASGTINLGGAHPVVDFDEIEVGSVPGFVLAPFKSLVEDAIEELLKKVDLEHRLTPTLSEGQATIEGVP
jgi:hypothetical protein